MTHNIQQQYVVVVVFIIGEFTQLTNMFPLPVHPAAPGQFTLKLAKFLVRPVQTLKAN